MIKINSIKTSINTLLKNVENIDVFYTTVSKTDGSVPIDQYFHVALKPISTSLFGKLMRDRAFFIDISYINHKGDENTFLEWFEKMNDAFLPYIQIEDSFITIEETNFKTVDNVGHYIFTLKFRDVVDFEQTAETIKDIHIMTKEE